MRTGTERAAPYGRAQYMLASPTRTRATLPVSQQRRVAGAASRRRLELAPKAPTGGTADWLCSAPKSFGASDNLQSMSASAGLTDRPVEKKPGTHPETAIQADAMALLIDSVRDLPRVTTATTSRSNRIERRLSAEADGDTGFDGYNTHDGRASARAAVGGSWGYVYGRSTEQDVSIRWIADSGNIARPLAFASRAAAASSVYPGSTLPVARAEADCLDAWAR